MRVVGLLGLACIATAFAIAAIHQRFTGDASVLELVTHGVLYAALLGLVVMVRLDLPSQIRAWRLRRTLRAIPAR
ncbi:MAG TPA: hypothetical protein VFH78_09500 [Candidatus Thermoplasmatota archaeon]|nr:hypothetical protein [Candidatus Thermoplasmatota archaeon]